MNSVKNTILAVSVLIAFSFSFNSGLAYSSESSANSTSMTDFDLSILDDVDGIINNVFKNFVPGQGLPGLNSFSLPKATQSPQKATQPAATEDTESMGEILFNILKLSVSLFTVSLYIVIEILKAISLYLNSN